MSPTASTGTHAARAQRVLLVDDEAPARDRLRRLLGELPGVEVAGEAGNGSDALARVAELHPDVVLLDVRMPGMGGLEAARHLAALPDPPAVVFCTAYDSYAVEAFEAQAIGYLLKPVRAEKLSAALARAARLPAARASQLAAGDPAQPARTHIAARLGEQLRLIPVGEVWCFLADQKYTTVRHRGGSDLIEEPLRALEDEFASRFVRVHRNALVAVDQVAAIERDAEGQHHVVLRATGEHITVSRRLAGDLQARLRG